ncbi:MAG: hypothetical protein V1660_01835 [archaeon]
MSLFKKREPERAERSFDVPELPAFPEVREIKDALTPRDNFNDSIPPLPRGSSISQNPYSMPQQQKPEPKRAMEIGSSAWPPEIKMPSSKEIFDLTTEAGEEREESASPSKHSYPKTPPQSQSRQIKAKEPIFIKIERFSDALKNFDQIKEKVDELDDLLKKTREIRHQEQQEFDSWEKEIEEIKNKISVIDEKLFSKLG